MIITGKCKKANGTNNRLKTLNSLKKLYAKNNDDLSKSNAMLSRIRNANTKMQTLNNTKTALKAYPL